MDIISNRRPRGEQTPDPSAPLAPANDDVHSRALAQPVTVSLFENANGQTLSKIVFLNADGLQKRAGANLTRGTVRRQTCASLAEVLDLISALTPSQAIAAGVCEHEHATVLSERAAQNHTGAGPTITRTKETFAYGTGPGLMLLDHDPAPGAEPFTPDELINTLRAAVPALQLVTLGWKPSAGSCIASTATGEELRGITGQHVFLVVEDARQIPEIGEHIESRLWLAGHGYAIVDHAGRIHLRTPVDACVWQPERLIFGRAECRQSVVQVMPPPRIIDGAHDEILDCEHALDFNDLPPLTAAERAQIARLQAEAKAARADEAAQVRHEWAEKRAQEAIKHQGLEDTPENRKRLRGQFERAEELLPLDLVLFPKDGDPVTAREVFDNFDAWKDREFADPLDPDYGNGDPRIAIAIRSGGEPAIFSHAHHGTTYFFRTEDERLREEMGTLEPVPLASGALILPSEHFSYVESAACIFDVLAKTKTLFVRSGAVVELTQGEHGPRLGLVRPTALQSRIDAYGTTMGHVLVHGRLALKKKRCPRQVAEVLLDTLTAKEVLPSITLLAAAPLAIEHEGGMKILGRGYHAEAGGVLVTGGKTAPMVPVAEAAPALRALLKDFDFVSPGDEARALAMFITPALKMGGFIDRATPLDVAEADQSQSGKTYRQEITRAIYREHAYPVLNRSGGVGSLDESFAAALLSGSAFISFDNIRGKIDSQYLEGVVTWGGSVKARVPHRGEVDVDASRVNIALSSNGIDTTRDLANRSCIVRIRKQPPGYQWFRWPEGDLAAHIAAQQPYYLACVHAVVRHWLEAGKPATSETRHDMRKWAGVLDWIVQNVFGAAPLMDGHLEAQERVSNPAFVWLRQVCLSLEHEKRLDEELSASAIWEFGQEQGLDLLRTRGATVDGAKHVGQLMARVFRTAGGDTAEVDGFLVTRIERQEWDEQQRKERVRRRYVFTRPDTVVTQHQGKHTGDTYEKPNAEETK